MEAYNAETAQMPEQTKRNMIQCENLVKIYKTKDIEVMALQGLDLIVEEGELMSIIGNSGSGKSTLLNMIGGLDRPSAGKLYVDGKDCLSSPRRSWSATSSLPSALCGRTTRETCFPISPPCRTSRFPCFFIM
jgi:ABC-type multidrug transport system ATPase subunit